MTDPTIGAFPLATADSKELLGRVLSRIRSQERSITVFDLDSTLLDNGPRQAAILREYGTDLGIPELAKSKAEHWVTWDVGQAMSNGGLSSEGVEKHRDSFKAYWRERFFTSEYCVVDEMVDGALGFVQAVVSAGGKVFYVTGRHEEMRVGTVSCFERLGFPLPNEQDVRLLMKPTLAEDDDVYKLRTYAELEEQGTVVAAFDNEPTHINGYHTAFPDAFSIHLATNHSGRTIQVAKGVTSILDFSI